ncbi:25608_t:CDS:2 [Gigaspora margarita]|uniref:25608_t:CDS:1 n=1 Tax=Gigaspora margarita TaxID=4874 RepID=A0ABN7UX66_GIGMA|nr:25608_t:CDS:2 [Gigaspora margarita]
MSNFENQSLKESEILDNIIIEFLPRTNRNCQILFEFSEKLNKIEDKDNETKFNQINGFLLLVQERELKKKI